MGVPFESLGTISYSPSIVTMALSCIIREIKTLVKNRNFFIPPAFDAPVNGILIRILPWRLVRKN